LSNTVELIAAVHHEDGTYWAEVADLPGLFATGDTLDELLEALMEAYVLYVNDGPGVVSIQRDADRAEPAELKFRVPVPA
jgi:predicted RNase H-like HicB family nuclease